MAGGFEAAQSDPTDMSNFQGAGTLEEAAHHLYMVVPEVNIVHLAITLLSLFVTFFGLFSGIVKERLYLGEAIIATGFGVAFSAYAAGIFAPRTWSAGHHFDELTLELTRIVIALSVFAIGVELPKAYVLRHWKSLCMLLGPIMFLGWMVAAALMYAIIPGLEFLPALVVAAGVTPTDPILASSVVGKGKFAQEHVPAHIRHILQAESGCNDGAAFPFLYIALFLLLREGHSIGHAIGYWFLLCLLYQIVLGTIIGACVGILARKLLKFSKRRELIDRESMVAMYVALALLVTGLTTLAGSDDLLAAFACGTAFAWDDWFTESIEESNFSSTIDLLANCAIFIYLGATMPFSSWQSDILTLTVWRLVLLAVGILALRRLPGIFALQWWIPDIKTRREAMFVGHFGPMGVGAIFISTLAASKLPTPTVPPVTALDTLALVVQPVTYFIVLSSILVHGLTISFFTLGRRVHSRVTSISRTFTQNSRSDTQYAEEPSWMSRVKRAQNREDIVINRDDDGDNEKVGTAAESGDIGKLAMFGAPAVVSEPSTGSETAGSSEKDLEKGSPEASGSDIIDEDDDEACLTERPTLANRKSRTRVSMRRERDDDPPKNILASDENEEEEEAHTHEHQEHHVTPEEGEPKAPARPKSKTRDSAADARYCAADQTQTWQEGRHIIIDKNDGTDVEVIDLDASPEDARRAHQNPLRRVLTIPDHVLEQEKANTPRGSATPKQHEENAVNRITTRMLKAGTLVGAATGALLGAKKDDGLTPEQREAKRKEKLKKDAWCRKEQKFRDTTDREWMEGSKVVTEHFDGSVEVRELTEEEKRARAARHLAALKALGAPIESVEAELAKLTKSSSHTGSVKGKEISRPFQDGEGPVASTSAGTGAAGGRGRGGAPRPSKGVALERTERIESSSDDEGPGAPISSVPASARESPNPTPRPSPPMRSNSAMNAMRNMFGGRSTSTTRDASAARSPRASGGAFTEEPEEEELSPIETEDELQAPSGIRFAEVQRPEREGSSSAGRPIPSLGTGLRVTRTRSVDKR